MQAKSTLRLPNTGRGGGPGRPPLCYKLVSATPEARQQPRPPGTEHTSGDQSDAGQVAAGVTAEKCGARGLTLTAGWPHPVAGHTEPPSPTSPRGPCVHPVTKHEDSRHQGPGAQTASGQGDVRTLDAYRQPQQHLADAITAHFRLEVHLCVPFPHPPPSLWRCEKGGGPGPGGPGNSRSQHTGPQVWVLPLTLACLVGIMLGFPGDPGSGSFSGPRSAEACGKPVSTHGSWTGPGEPGPLSTCSRSTCRNSGYPGSP